MISAAAAKTIRAAATQDAHTWLIDSPGQPSCLAELHLYVRGKGPAFDAAVKVIGDRKAFAIYSAAFDAVMSRAA